jgi:O-antigen/teichoic acid export membrane protein
VVVVGTRGIAILLIGFVGSVVVARLLTPRDFGVVAIGLSLVLFAGLLADGGLGAALIRRAEPPSNQELAAVTGFQLVVTVGLAFVVAAIAAPFGETGWVVALMVTSMPLVTLQVPGRIRLERELSYRPLVFVEVAQVVTYWAWAIGFVVAGGGVWGLASATVARAVAGAALMSWLSPVGLLRPAFSWMRVRALLGFGIRFQGAAATWLVRDQALNACIAAIAGIGTLGYWSLARRLLEVPFLLLESLWRVSFPTMAKLVAAEEDVAPLLIRAVGIAAVASGLLLTALAGSASGLIPGLFGEQWREASTAVPWACLGLGISGPTLAASLGYLYAVGDASAVLRAEILNALALFVVTLPLLPTLGVEAVGVGWLVSSAVQAFVLQRAAQRWTRVRLLRPLLVPLCVGIVAVGIGRLVTDAGGDDLWAGLAGGACSSLCFLGGLLVFKRRLVYETLRFAVSSVRAAASRGSRPTAEPA